MVRIGKRIGDRSSVTQHLFLGILTKSRVPKNLKIHMDTNETANTAPQQKFNPKNFVDYFNLGVDCYQREDKQGAINAWTQALRIDPQNPHAYYYRGVTRAEIGHYNSAVEDFNHAIHINPKYSNAYYQRDKVSQKLL
ncbi:MAG TPA: tetratricopeptide repeat protein, partial [Phormidium sp.]